MNFDIEKFHSFLLLLLLCPPPSSPLPFPGATAASRGFREKKEKKVRLFFFGGKLGCFAVGRKTKWKRKERDFFKKLLMDDGNFLFFFLSLLLPPVLSSN